MLNERIVQAITDRPLERLMEDASPAERVQLPQFRFQLRYVSRCPLLDYRRIEAAQLCNVKERPRAFGRGSRLRRRTARAERPAQLGHRAVEGDSLHGLIERGALEQQPNGEIPAQCHADVPRRHAVGPFLDLPDDTRPSAQSEQLSAQVVDPLILGHAERSERVHDRLERIPIRGAILLDKPRQRPRPAPAACCQRRAVDLEEAAVNAVIAFRHRPVRKPLIEVSGEESNERRMEPRIDIDVADGQQPVAMTDRSIANREGPRRISMRRPRMGAIRGCEAGIPQATDGAPLLARPVDRLPQRGQC